MEDISDYKHITSINSNYLPHDFVIHRKIVWNIDNYKEFELSNTEEEKLHQALNEVAEPGHPKMVEVFISKLCEHKSIEIIMTVDRALDENCSLLFESVIIQENTPPTGEQCVCNSLCTCEEDDCDVISQCQCQGICRCFCCDYRLLKNTHCTVESNGKEMKLGHNKDCETERSDAYDADLWEVESEDETIGDKLSIRFELKLAFEVKRRSFINRFEEFIGNECFNDFSMICSDGMKVIANSMILAICSPVFKAMLQSDMIEKQKKEILISDIESGTMRELINFLYSGCVANLDNYAELLLYAAVKYQIITLKYVCITHLQKHLKPENAFDALQLADFYNLKLLYAECIGLIWNTHDDVKELAEFKSLNTQLQEKVIAERETIIIEIKSKYEPTEEMDESS